VLNRYDDGVIVVRETEKVATLSLAGRKPKDITIASNGYVYVVSGHSKISADQESVVEGNVTIISDTQVIGTIPLGRTIPTQVVADPLRNDVYVGGMDEEVVVIEDLQITTRIPITADVKVMDANPQTGDIYILDVHGYLHQIQQRQIVATLGVAEEYSVAQNMQVHPTTGDVYLVNTGGEALVVRNMQIVAQIPLESGAFRMDIDPLTGNVYVANYRKDNVSVIYDTEIITTIQVGWYPYGIGVNPTNGWVYVSNTNDSTVTILGYPDN
jgi:YVTN family beta-propeller protein